MKWESSLLRLLLPVIPPRFAAIAAVGLGLIEGDIGAADHLLQGDGR